MNGVKRKKGFTVCGCVGPGGGGGGGKRERERERERAEGCMSGREGGRLACLCPWRLI